MLVDLETQDKLLFSGKKLGEMFSKTGDVTKLLGDIMEKTRETLEQSFTALQTFKNATLEVADVQRQMAAHRLKSELAILDKRESNS